MGDNLSPIQRSDCMRRVHGADTTPEITVRRLLHSMGYRYGLHVKRLLGKPDIVLVSRRKIIFVHGCFWHKHRCSHGRVSPTTNSGYWDEKRRRNAERDRRNIRSLRGQGWDVLVIWECWTSGERKLQHRLKAFLER
ncbi:MAG: very short patch repair endonuclease [Acidobacteriaceae bacterium]